MNDSARLAWRCRRGTRELDIMLRGFLDSQYPLLRPSERKDFEQLLEMQDPVLIEWFWGRTRPPDELAPLVARIREFATSRLRNPS